MHMHEYILAIQNLLVVIFISYSKCFFYAFAFSFFASYKAMIAFPK
jgi:hypothetical protein